MNKVICDVYKSPREDEMYLYVAKAEGLKRVPELLLEKFGKPKHVMTMLLTEDKKLGRAEAVKVLQQLDEKGFYLQLPPPKDEQMAAIHLQNTKMGLSK